LKCKATTNGIEVWTGNKTASVYSKIWSSGDGFSTRVNLKISPFEKTKEDHDTLKCTARYRFFRITEECDGVRYLPSGDFGKIMDWDPVTGPATCADTGVTKWEACSAVRGLPNARLCVTTYYCPDADCKTTNVNGDNVNLYPDALKYDVKITGLDATRCSGNPDYGIQVRGATKSDLKTKGKTAATSEGDGSGGVCPVTFSWASGLKVNGETKPIDFKTCNACSTSANDEEQEKAGSDEKNHCCSFSLLKGAANTVAWDPSVSFSGVSSLFSLSMSAIFLVAAATLV
jgi:hypothetical protein